MENLSNFLEERFAKITSPTQLLLLSHAEDSLRDESDTHSGRILSWMQENLDVVLVPLYGKLPHATNGQLGVHPSADMREVAAVLTPFVDAIRRFLALGRCVFLGKEPAKVLSYALDANTLQPAVELPHPQHWDQKQAGAEALGVETVIRKLQPLYDSPKWDALPSVVRSTRQTSKRQAAQRETGQLSGKLIHPPASEKQIENCRAVGKQFGGAKEATARSREASAATGRITGLSTLTAQGRKTCAEVALRTMETEEGKRRQIEKGHRMVERRDEENTKEAGKKGRAAHWGAEAPCAHINAEVVREQIKAGITATELSHEYIVEIPPLRGWMGNQTPKILPAEIPKKDFTHNLDSEAKRHAKKLYELGVNPVKIAILLEKPVNVFEVGKVLGVNKGAEHIKPKEPMTNWIKGEWLSKEDLSYLVQNFEIIRLARCFRKGGHLENWKKFFERTKAGEDVVNPCRMPKKSAKKKNAALRNGVDIDEYAAERNASVRATAKAQTEENASRKRRVREGEDADARQKLQERKKARPSTKSSKSSSSGGALTRNEERIRP